jgi:hypothetical protein
LAAPPATKTSVPDGRITIWVGDKIEHFKPDGSETATIDPSDEVKSHSYGIRISPDRSTACYRDVEFKGDEVITNRLVLAPVDGGTKSFVLAGYTVDQTAFATVGKRLFFSGSKGEKKVADAVVELFEMNLTTKRIVTITRIPDKHGVSAISPTGVVLSSRAERSETTFSRRSYVLGTDGKPVEILTDILVPWNAEFSPAGTKFLFEGWEFVSNKNADARKRKPLTYQVFDVATKTAVPIRWFPVTPSGRLAGWAWSPNGSRISYVWYDSTPIAPVPPPRPAGGGKVAIPGPEYEFKVFVADADGGNPKETYKSKGARLRVFTWN